MYVRLTCIILIELAGVCALAQDRGIVVEPANVEDTGKSLAILVGVQDYDRAAKLKYCRNDVELLAKTLRESCKFDTVVTLTEDNENKRYRPTKGNIISELDLWLKVANSNRYRRVLVYFSGHGFRDEKDRLYFAPPDCHMKQLELTGLPMSYVKQTLDGCVNVPIKLLILDTCHAGESKGAAEGVTGSDIAAFENARGLYTIASCDGDEYSMEWKDKQQGVFTYWLCQGLQGAADADRDQRVDTGELYKYVYGRVLKTSAELGHAQNVVERPSTDWRGVAVLSRVAHVVNKPELPRLAPLTTVTLFNAATSDGAKLYLRQSGGKSIVLDRGRSLQITYEASDGFWYYSGDSAREESGWVHVVASSSDRLEFNIEQTSGKTIWQPHRTLRDSVGNKLVRIEPGEFLMGSRDRPQTLGQLYNENQALFADEHPQHKVRITKPFYMGATEVTRGQFRQFVAATDFRTDAERDGAGGTGFDPSAAARLGDSNSASSWSKPGHKIYDDTHPVVMVSWRDAKAYCDWLTKVEGVGYRLPTEAEWEYAARAGTVTRYWTGNDAATLATAANGPDVTFREAEERSGQRLTYATLRHRDGFVATAPVASFRPNRFGLYDMHANVWEWCEDAYDPAAYGRHALENPLTRKVTDLRITRGGCYM